ncbi:MAG: TonB-dependent receptor [Candidatus Solibacter sp.]
MKLGVDELFGIQVTSVGRKAQQLSKAPAAVFVLTGEDIRRSGATSIPEALRHVPGLTVLRLDGRSWAVSARGGSRMYADKMLVMIDGRSLYIPLFSGQIWDTIDVSLPDVERIEIMRGPGAVMWGPNAVNGVINIITKRAQSTRGGMASVSGGNERRASLDVREGAAPSDRLAYRVWGKAAYDTPAYDSPGYFNFAGQVIVRDPQIHNLDFSTIRLGFRVDGESGERDSWTVQGDTYRNNRQDPIAVAVALPEVRRFQAHSDYQGGFIQAQWTHTARAGGESVFKFSYDRTNVDYPFLTGQLNNVVLDWQKRMPVTERHEVYVGGGYQQYGDSLAGRNFMSFDPARSVHRLGDVVVRDEWQIVPQRWMLSVGARLDYSRNIHLEYQPSARLLYTPSAGESWWFAVSRAVRAPTRYDLDLYVEAGRVATPYGVPLLLEFSGSKTMTSERERGVELGYRRQSGQRWSVDVSTFWSYYNRLRVLQGPAVPALLWTGTELLLKSSMTERNFGKGRSYGGEIWGYLQVTPTWRLTPSYSYLNEVRWLPRDPVHAYAWDSLLAGIAHQGSLRSQHELTRSLQLDLTVSARARNGAMNLPGVFLLDARLGWRPRSWGEASIALQNVADRRVLDSYMEMLTPAIPLRRMFVIQWTQRF